MNIAVLTAEGKVVVRPDTTRIKDSEDSYLPEFVNRVEWSPVIYTKIIKSGKSVSERFAHRYFDNFNTGILLFAADLIDGSEQGYACASCLDHTSALNLQIDDDNSLNMGINKIVIRCNNKVLYSENIDICNSIIKAIVEVTKFCWLRVGDLLAVELQTKKELCKRGENTPTVSCLIGGKEILNFKVVL